MYISSEHGNVIYLKYPTYQYTEALHTQPLLWGGVIYLKTTVFTFR